MSQSVLSIRLFRVIVHHAVGKVKTRFYERTKINKISHRCIQIDRWAKLTCRHRPMDIGAALAEDQTCYFIIGRQEKLYF